MKYLISLLVSIVVFISICFYPLINSKLVPLPFNLLASFYTPFSLEKFENYPGGIPNKPMGTDIIKLFYPFRKYTNERLRSASIPWWNPYVFAGNVHVGTYQSAVFYPLNAIYFIVSDMNGWTFLVLVQPLIAALGVYFFSRELKLSHSASIISALTFAFSGWMIAWFEESIVIVHSIIWLPWVCLGIKKIFENNRLGSPILFIAIIFSITAGFLQMTLYVAIVSFFYVCFLCKTRSFQNILRPISLVLLTSLSAVLTCSPQLLPALEAYSLSPRGTVRADFLFRDYLMPLSHLITFLAPDFWGNPGTYNYFFPRAFFHERVIFIGIIPIVLALIGLIRNKKPEVIFFSIVTFISLVFGLQTPIAWLAYYFHIPIFSSILPGRVFIITTFSLAMLSGFGWDYLKTTKDKIIINAISAGILIIFLGLFSVTIFSSLVYGNCHKYPLGGLFSTCLHLKELFEPYWDASSANISLRNLLIPFTLFISTFIVLHVTRINRRIAFLGVLLLMAVSVRVAASKYLYFSDRVFEYPKNEMLLELKKIAGIDRVWAYGNATFTRNIPMAYGLYSSEGYDALFNRKIGELFHTIKTNGIISDNIPRTDVEFSGAVENEKIIDNTFRLRLLAMTNTQYIVETLYGENKSSITTSDRFPSGLFSLVKQINGYRIWKYLDALPRAYVAGSVVTVKDRQETASEIFSDNFLKNREVVLTKNTTIHPTNSQFKNAEITEYLPEKIVITATSNEPSILVLSDTFFPGWRALVNGKESEIFEANYSFRGVIIPEGKSTVTFIYKPLYLQYILPLLFIGVALLILINIGNFKVTAGLSRKQVLG